MKDNMKIQANNPWASMLSEGNSFYILNIEHWKLILKKSANSDFFIYIGSLQIEIV